MKNRIIPILVIILVAAQHPLCAQMQWKVDTTHIRLGEQIMLSIRGAATYPTINELSQDSLVAVEQWYDTTAATQHTLLTSFEEGQHWLRLGDDSLLITVDDVVNVDTASSDIKDIADIANEPITAYDILHWGWLPLLVALLVWIVLWWRRRRKRLITNNEQQPAIPLLPPDQQALLDLEQLRQKQLWQQGKVKDYHTELTDILRLYLERAHNIPSTEMTSDQTLDAYDDLRMADNGNRERLRRILQTADMVKFAKSEPLPYEHDRSLGDAVEFVKNEQTTNNAAQQTIDNTSEKEAPHA